jgi:hypothetical protein
VIRYVVRSTANGDVEMYINTASGKTKVKKEIKKAGCMKLWEKSCFEEKNYDFSITKAKVKKLMDSIKKNKIFTLELNYLPKPGEEQYSIGFLEKNKKAQYVNCTQTKLEEQPGFKKVQQELQKIVDSEIN